ncbi:hypothetical protein V493_00957 [Pseudogymnoascus sp. VKM F-4281 (FW-2241)]|nr:hypothetical protein V493_00957 [Pseudogymnoascus sp. VKM F-4281 (FW-2241)]
MENGPRVYRAWKDLSIGVEQEDPTIGPIFERELELNALIDPRLLEAPELNYGLSSSSELTSGSEQSLAIELRAQSTTRTRAQARAQAHPPRPLDDFLVGNIIRCLNHCENDGAGAFEITINASYQLYVFMGLLITMTATRPGKSTTVRWSPVLPTTYWGVMRIGVRGYGRGGIG